MQSIANDVIGTLLHQIWHGNPDAAPPIHIWTRERPEEGCLFLGINALMEHVEQGGTLPSAVMILTVNTRKGDGPYLLFWVERPNDPVLLKKIIEWQINLGLQAQEIITMGIGNIV